METYDFLKIFTSLVIILLPFILIVRDWKFRNTNSKSYNKLTITIISLGLLAGFSNGYYNYKDLEVKKETQKNEAKEKQLAKNNEEMVAWISVANVNLILKNRAQNYSSYVGNVFGDEYDNDGYKYSYIGFPFEKMVRVNDINSYNLGKIGVTHNNNLQFFHEQLIDGARTCIGIIDNGKYPEITMLLNRIILEGEKFNPFVNINKVNELIESKEIFGDNKIKKYIKTYSKEITFPASLTKYVGDPILPYIQLYNQLNKEMEILIELNELMDKAAENHME